jgi:hypothetical protein
MYTNEKKERGAISQNEGMIERYIVDEGEDLSPGHTIQDF